MMETFLQKTEYSELLMDKFLNETFDLPDVIISLKGETIFKTLLLLFNKHMKAYQIEQSLKLAMRLLKCFNSVKSMNTFFAMLSNVPFMTNAATSESVKMEIMNSLNFVLCYYKDTGDCAYFISVDRFDFTGHWIHYLLSLACEDQRMGCPDLIMASLDNLILILDLFTFAENGTVGRFMMPSFFPGIWSNMCKLIRTQNHLNHKIYIKCFDILEKSALLALVSDEKDNLDKNAINENFKHLIVEKNDVWIKNTDSKVNQTFSKFPNFVSHSISVVRGRYVRFLVEFFTAFNSTFPLTCSELILPIAEFTADTNENVSREAKRLFESEIFDLNPQLRNKFVTRFIQISNALRLTNIKAISDIDILLKHLYGCICILSNELDCLLACDNLKSFLHALLHCLELRQDSIIDISYTKKCVLDSSMYFLGESFLLNNKQLYHTYICIARLLCKSSFLHIVISSLLEYAKTSKYHLKALYLLSVFTKETPAVESFPRDVISTCISLCSEILKEMLNYTTENSNEIKYCLLSIALICSLLANLIRLSETPQKWLADCLFDLLLCCNHSSALVSEAALSSLKILTEFFNAKSIENFLEINASYVIENIILRIRMCDESVVPVRVLSALISLGNYDLINRLDYIIDDFFVLLRISAKKELRQAIVNMFYILSEKIRNTCFNNVPLHSQNEDVFSSFTKLILKIMNTAQYLLFDSDATIRNTAVQLCSSCVDIIATNENEFLPLVHKMWQGLVKHLFSEDNNAQDDAIIQLVIKLSETCRDFVKPRVIKDVYKPIIERLKKRFCVNLNLQQSSTVESKNSYNIMCKTAELACKLKLSCLDIRYLCETFLNFCVNDKTKECTLASVKAIDILANYDPNTVWLCLQINVFSNTFVPSDDSLKDIDFSKFTKLDISEQCFSALMKICNKI